MTEKKVLIPKIMPKMTLRIPEMITIGGFRIHTKYSPTLLADRARYGEYCSRTMTITIDSNLSDQRRALNYCHEVVEAICDVHHLHLEESTVQAFALSIHEIIHQNNVLYAAITEKDE